MMKSLVEVAVIGAGHAGLNAIKEIRKITDDWVLINGGPLGTTCARIGCMPSKIAIHLADTFKVRDRFDRYGVGGGEQLHLDQQALPESVAVIGLGPIGLEIGQALHRLGTKVTGIDLGTQVSRLKEPAVNRAAIDILSREFPLWLGDEPTIERHDDGFRVRAGEREAQVDKLFLALGRYPHLEHLHLERLGVPMGQHGVPVHDPATLQVGRLPIYMAGDAAGGIANLQRAAAQGRIAGHNATHRKKQQWPQRTPMAIVFCEPNIACVGQQWDALDMERTAVAEQRFGPVGRALIMGQNRGLLRVYADRRSGRLLGASMVGPRCEHLAHLICWAIESGMTVERALEMPFYHPVIEEALQDALLDLRLELTRSKAKRRYAFFRPWATLAKLGAEST